MGWHSQNRRRSRDAEEAIRAAAAPLVRAGGYFSAADLVTHYGLTTRRKYLEYMTDQGEIEAARLGPRGLLVYRKKGVAV